MEGRWVVEPLWRKWVTGAGLEVLQFSLTSCLFCVMAVDAVWPAALPRTPVVMIHHSTGHVFLLVRYLVTARKVTTVATSPSSPQLYTVYC